MNPLLSAISRYIARPHRNRGRIQKRHRKTQRQRLCLEALEDRNLLSPYIVTTTADSGAGSLRDAINQINADSSHIQYVSPSNPNVDEIDFNITAASDAAGGGTGFNATTGVATITPQSALPAITNAVLIDGYSQPGASGNTNAFGLADNAQLKVELNGAAAGNVIGLEIETPDTTVRGLVINRFADRGIFVGGDGSGNNWIYGNFIGVDPTGTVNEGNQTGINCTALWWTLRRSAMSASSRGLRPRSSRGPASLARHPRHAVATLMVVDSR